jgi:hypothetical protein
LFTMAPASSSAAGGSSSNGAAKDGKDEKVPVEQAAGGGAEPLSSLAMILYSLYFVALLQAFYMAITMAYEIRLYAIKEYGRVIHEFDPYFNYRAAEYLWAHGWHAFSHWYDDMVW